MKFLLVIICTVVMAQATMQTPDRFIYEGDTLLVRTFPLESDTAFKKTHTDIYVDSGYTGSSANYRRYVATWKIENKKLMLIGIDTWKQSSNSSRWVDSSGTFKGEWNSQFSKPSIEELFPHRHKNGVVFAHWYSGKIVVGTIKGKTTEVLVIQNGYVVDCLNTIPIE